jgi:hypothetical protein
MQCCLSRICTLINCKSSHEHYSCQLKMSLIWEFGNILRTESRRRVLFVRQYCLLLSQFVITSNILKEAKEKRTTYPFLFSDPSPWKDIKKFMSPLRFHCPIRFSVQSLLTLVSCIWVTLDRVWIGDWFIYHLWLVITTISKAVVVSNTVQFSVSFLFSSPLVTVSSGRHSSSSGCANYPHASATTVLN